MPSSLPILRSTAIDCLRAPYDAPAAARARASLAQPAFDWGAFLDYINQERITPLIDQAASAWGLFPPGFASTVRQAYLQVMWTNVLRQEELRQVLTHLTAAGIPAVLLKGAALLHAVYLKSGLRPMADTDLLIPAAEMQRAGQILADLGYSPLIAPSVPQDLLVELAYHKPGRVPWNLELHSSLFNPPHQLSEEQLDWFWRSRVRLEGEAVEAWIFSPTAQLLHLCAHLWLPHRGGNLLWVHDLYQLIRLYADRIDWQELLSVAQSFDLLLPLQKALPELAESWGSPVPPDVLASLSRLPPSQREQRKFGMGWGADQDYARTLLAGALSHPDWRSRLRYAGVILFPPRQYIIERYHVHRPILLPFYYAHRLLARLAQQAARLAQRAARKMVG